MFSFILKEKCFVTLIDCTNGSSTRSECIEKLKDCLQDCKNSKVCSDFRNEISSVDRVILMSITGGEVRVTNCNNVN